MLMAPRGDESEVVLIARVKIRAEQTTELLLALRSLDNRFGSVDVEGPDARKLVGLRRRSIRSGRDGRRRGWGGWGNRGSLHVDRFDPPIVRGGIWHLPGCAGVRRDEWFRREMNSIGRPPLLDKDGRLEAEFSAGECADEPGRRCPGEIDACWLVVGRFPNIPLLCGKAGMTRFPTRT